MGYRPIIVLILTMVLSGCAATRPEVDQLNPHATFYDAAFPEASRYTLETEQEIFALDEEARVFVHQAMAGATDPYERMNALVNSIFDRAELNLLYMTEANTTASQTFHSRAANCLSMSIMTYAMASEAGFRVRFRDVEIPEYWTRRDGYNFLSDHLNLVLIPKVDPEMVRLLNNALVVDFDPQAGRSHFPNRVVSKNTVVAMFYNNKGADALLAKDSDRAYAYFRKAIETDPWFDSARVNLGFLYRQQGLFDLAEASYRQALRINADNLSAWESIARIYQQTGRAVEAEKLFARVERERKDNPFFHFIQGEEAFDKRDYETALKYYYKALSLDNTKHEIYFGLAKAYYRLGQIGRSEEYLVKAKRKSRSLQDRERYQGKLDLLAGGVSQHHQGS